MLKSSVLRLQWTVLTTEPIQTPATTGSSFTYSCNTGSAVVFSSSSVSGASASWAVTAIYGSGSSHQTGDSFTVTIAAAAIVDLVDNFMSAAAWSLPGNAVTFGPCCEIPACLTRLVCQTTSLQC